MRKDVAFACGGSPATDDETVPAGGTDLPVGVVHVDVVRTQTEHIGAGVPQNIKSIVMRCYLLPMWVCTLAEGVSGPVCYELHMCASPWHLAVLATLCVGPVFGLPTLVTWANKVMTVVYPLYEMRAYLVG